MKRRRGRVSQQELDALIAEVKRDKEEHVIASPIYGVRQKLNSESLNINITPFDSPNNLNDKGSIVNHSAEISNVKNRKDCEIRGR